MKNNFKLEVELITTFETQIEILPRISIIYGKGFEFDDGTIMSKNGIAFEWLWFSLFIGK